MSFWFQVTSGWRRTWTWSQNLVGPWTLLVMVVLYHTSWKPLELLVQSFREYTMRGSSGSPRNSTVTSSGYSPGIKPARLICWLTINRSISTTSSIPVVHILMCVWTSTLGKFVESIPSIRSGRWRLRLTMSNRWLSYFWNSILGPGHCSRIMWCWCRLEMILGED